MEKHPLHIKNPELQKSGEVSRAVARKESRTGEKIPNDPSARIEAYTERLANIFLNPDEATRKRNIELFRDDIYNALLIKKEDFPESYFELQQRIARDRGVAVDEIPQNIREQMIATSIEDQKQSLDNWIDYLSSNDAVYPPWFKLYAWQQITKLSQFDKERGEFKKRTKSTVAPFPDIYSEPLAIIADLYEQVKENNNNTEARREFDKKFPSLYAELIQKTLEAQAEQGEEIRGEWVKYEKGKQGEAEKLFASLQNQGTGWCTAGKSTAQQQINSGDFYVFYTLDEEGKPTKPRLAIRMEGEEIGEVRGKLGRQEVEPILQPILDAKLADFGPKAEKFRKKSADVQHLKTLKEKQEKGEAFTKDDLTFLYELNSPIEGFGYGKHPYIAELLNERNLEEDILVIFDCTKEQVAHSVAEITDATKVYVGKLEPNIFQKLPETIEYIYTKFPEERIRRYDIEIGGKTKQQLVNYLRASGHKISDFAESMLENPAFTVLEKREQAKLIRLRVKDMGLPSGATTEQIFAKAEELGLELCPPEVGPQFRLQYVNQPMDEYITVGMKPISDSGGYPDVFLVGCDHDGPWLYHSWAGPANKWRRDDEFVFRFRKKPLKP